jgi:hypothetical protein
MRGTLVSYVSITPTSLLFVGECLEMLKQLPDNSVDALITDPPAGIGFMAKEWDSDRGDPLEWIKWLGGIMAECRRVLKPGAHGLVWALPRTSHWTGFALEFLAGFQIRDVLHHAFFNGFPKSKWLDEAKTVGTALKPALEHWKLVRKAVPGSTTACYAEHGTGGLNIADCRVGEEVTLRPSGEMGYGGGNLGAGEETGSTDGRWPSHLVIDEAFGEWLDDETGERKSGSMRAGTLRGENAIFGKSGGSIATSRDIVAKGGPSRFFYCPKPGNKERDLGLADLPARSGGQVTGRVDGSAGLDNPRAGAGRNGNRKNIHPSVKAIALMRYMVRLICPPNGLVLDPFTGSGSTGCAAALEGRRFLGAELNVDDEGLARPAGEHYAAIAERRIRAAAELAKSVTDEEGDK